MSDMTLLAWGACIAGVSVLGIGAGVFLSAPRMLVGRLFLFFTAGLTMWGGSLGLLLLTHEFFYNQFIFYAGFFIFCGLFLLVLAYPQKRAVALWSYAAVVPGACVAALSAFNLFVSDIRIYENGIVEPVNGPLMPLYLAMCASYFAASLWVLVLRFRASRGQARLQMWYLVSALCLSTGTIVVADIALPALNIFSFIYAGPLSLIAFSALVGYAIVRHQLLDIRVAVQRSLIYTALLALVVGSYIALLNLASMLSGAPNFFWTAMATTIIGIFTAPALTRYFTRITDALFFKDKYDYAEALHTLSECLYASLDIETLVKECEARLAAIFKCGRVRIVPASAEAMGAEAAVPIVLEGAVIGTVYMGEKRSGDKYTARDMRLLETFALHAATAFGRALLYKQVAEHAAELEVKVAERTRELKEAQEMQKHMMLDISHNLQTPLTIFQTKLEKLKTLVHDGSIEALEDSLARLSICISDLLRLARLENSAEDAHMPLDFSSLVEEVLEEVSVVAWARGIGIKSAIERGLGVAGDTSALREVVLALASNSIKYMGEEGERNISFSLGAEGGLVRLDVADSGRGIAEEDLPRIFDRFWRAPGVQDTAGSGLGLAIAKHIVGRHGGTLEAKSEQGFGTTLTLRLPLIP